MREAGRHMDGLSLHYYCGTGRRSRSATNYEEADWFHLLRSALRMEELVRRHAAIMDQYDPPKRVGLMVDEWGTWHEVEPGTNPGFLYQQNTLRDALAAALTLNIFNNHADRVRMANIAQTVNVLQAMILTRQEKMLLTPTYHVYEMYVPHHDAILLPTDLQSADYAFGGEKIPALNVSASRDQAGRLHVTLCNLDAQQPAELEAEIRGGKVSRIAGRVLTAPAITAHNTFEQPENVKPAGLEGARITGAGFAVTLPPRSVVALELE